MKRRIGSILTAIMLMAVTLMPSQAFAASHDPIENKSSDTATIYMGKVLTASQAGKFPNINDFNFNLTAVKAWDNANKDASKSGNTIPIASMPMPAASTTAHQKVTVSGTSADIVVGDFKGSVNTAKKDTSTEKFRMTPLTIKFTKAGYYMYKVTEKSSTPASVPGVSYDKNSYYIVVYVCNKTDSAGNTINGVYVHDITSYRNDISSNAQPDLSDIQNKTDNGGKAAAKNTYENFGKVGKSTNDPGNDPDTGLPTGPDKLEAYKFFNDHTTHDIVITNNVQGNLGDRTKEFEFIVTLTGLDKGVTYTTNIPAEGKSDKNLTTSSTDLTGASKGTVSDTAKTITADASGNATFTARIADDEVLVINALPATSKYKVEEQESDHIASYSVTSTNTKAVIARKSAANTKDQTKLSTAEETVDAVSNVAGRVNADANDGTVTIAFVNTRNIVAITGLPYYGGHVYAMGAILVISMIMVTAVRRRSRQEA